MKKNFKVLVIFLISLFALLYLGCKPEGDIGSVEDLVKALGTKGLEAEPSGEISQDFFSVKGNIIRADGEDIQVFQYDSKAKADEEINLVSPDGGSIGTFMVTWISTPHFYRTDTMIILYIGDNEKIKSALNEITGPQFAGR